MRKRPEASETRRSSETMAAITGPTTRRKRALSRSPSEGGSPVLSSAGERSRGSQDSSPSAHRDGRARHHTETDGTAAEAERVATDSQGGDGGERGGRSGADPSQRGDFGGALGEFCEPAVAEEKTGDGGVLTTTAGERHTCGGDSPVQEHADHREWLNGEAMPSSGNSPPDIDHDQLAQMIFDIPPGGGGMFSSFLMESPTDLARGMSTESADGQPPGHPDAPLPVSASTPAHDSHRSVQHAMPPSVAAPLWHGEQSGYTGGRGAPGADVAGDGAGGATGRLDRVDAERGPPPPLEDLDFGVPVSLSASGLGSESADGLHDLRASAPSSSAADPYASTPHHQPHYQHQQHSVHQPHPHHELHSRQSNHHRHPPASSSLQHQHHSQQHHLPHAHHSQHHGESRGGGRDVGERDNSDALLPPDPAHRPSQPGPLPPALDTESAVRTAAQFALEELTPYPPPHGQLAEHTPPAGAPTREYLPSAPPPQHAPTPADMSRGVPPYYSAPGKPVDAWPVAAGSGQTDAQSIMNKRRQERNRREQKRSSQISRQIEELKEILENSGYTGLSKQSNKFSILQGAAICIRDLQDRNSQLTKRREALLRDGAALASGSGGSGGCSNGGGERIEELAGLRAKRKEVDTGPVSDINYKHVFNKAAVPMAIANTDGLLVECNAGFTSTSGIAEDELVQTSMFALIRPEELQHTYSWVALVLNNRPGTPSTFARRAFLRNDVDDMLLLMSFVRDDNKQPVYFHLALVTDDAENPDVAVPAPATVPPPPLSSTPEVDLGNFQTQR